MNCFGMLSRDAGHSRVPEPPQMMTGRILGTTLPISAPSRFEAAENSSVIGGVPRSMGEKVGAAVSEREDEKQRLQVGEIACICHAGQRV